MLNFIALIGLSTIVSATRLNTASGDGSTFSITSGISASQEQCLVVDGGNVNNDGAAVGLEPCANAVASGDGRVEWTIDSHGSLKSVSGNKCVSVNRGSLALSPCSENSPAVEFTSSGQLKVKSGANTYCVTQSGSSAGSEDAAFASPVQSSSSAAGLNHGAHKMVDGDDASYWMSDENEHQEITIDFGAPRNLKAFSIVWEGPAQSFSVQLTKNGVDWTTVYSTDVNSLFKTTGYLQYEEATKARIILASLHPLYGFVNGGRSYGIRRVSFIAPRLRTVVDDCADSSSSTDARDKYFVSYVSGYDLCPSKRTGQQKEALRAARVSLETATAQLAEKVSALKACKAQSLSFLAQHAMSPAPKGGADDDEVESYIESARNVVAAARSKVSSR